jgi:hypothetical protein
MRDWILSLGLERYRTGCGPHWCTYEVSVARFNDDRGSLNHGEGKEQCGHVRQMVRA